MKRHQLNFSLIELLIVIAIIAILSSLLQPSLRKVLDNVNSTSCLNNLRQINLVQNAYAEDYNEVYPIQNKIGQGQRRVPYFWDKKILVDVMVDDYKIKWKSFVCPSREFKPYLAPESNTTWKGDYFISYAYTTGLPSTNGSFYDTTPSAATMKVNKNTPDKIALADLNMNFYNSYHSIVNHSNLDYGTPFFKAPLPDMLKTIQGSNRLHIDGSGKWVTLDMMGKDGTSPNPNSQYTSRYSHLYDIRPYYW